MRELEAGEAEALPEGTRHIERPLLQRQVALNPTFIVKPIEGKLSL